MPHPRDPKEFRCTRHFEALAFKQGWSLVAGCDEAGRGALLGPLYVAAVILDPKKPILGLDDSKKLSPAEREEFSAQIRERAVAFRVVALDAQEVDALNVYEASRIGMLRALEALDPRPDFVLTDAMPLVRGRSSTSLTAPSEKSGGAPNSFSIPHLAIIHGDARSVSIAAASILAKVARDAHLDALDRVYPQYQLARNKGYGTAEHLEGLARFGPCPEHRKTFQPVKDYLLPLFPFGRQA